MIQLEHVSKVYPSSDGPVRALDDLTLQVGLGEFVAVRGPSGCGKSTLLMLSGGLASPTSGKVVVAGMNYGEMSSIERAEFRAESIGFVFQMFHLLPYLNVLDNVLVAGGKNGARNYARELLEQFQLSHRLKHRPDQLSVGERQRVAFARALLNKPKLILADEPTGNLDPENAAVVLDFLVDFHREGGSVLLVTHDDAAAQCAERTIHMREGKLDEEASADTANTSRDQE